MMINLLTHLLLAVILPFSLSLHYLIHHNALSDLSAEIPRERGKLERLTQQNLRLLVEIERTFNARELLERVPKDMRFPKSDEVMHVE